MYGQSVGSYVIQSPLGQGGMGMVYLAHHTLLGRPAAIKVLLPEFSRNTEIVNRFFNEARSATTVRHPGIVEIYDFGFLHDGSAYIVMEFLDGQSLAARIAARGRMQVLEALSIARQIAGALAAAHGKGIVHRDLKPDNVFMVRDPEMPSGERIKLLDFGIAKLAGDHPQGQKTRTGAVMGTPTYMAPEQCRGVAVDLRADLYALGCMVFEMLCGRAPFVGEGAGDVLAAHIHVPPPMPREFAPDVPPSVEALVLKLLTKDPAQRIQTADAVIAAIDDVSNGAARMSGASNAPSSGMRAGVVPTSPRMPSNPATEPTTLTGAAGAQTTPPLPAKRSLAVPLIAAGAVVVAAIVVVAVVVGGGGSGSKDAKASSSVAAATPAPTPPAPTPTPTPTPTPAKPTPTPAPTPPPTPTPAPTPTPTPPPTPPAPAQVTVTIDSTPSGATVLRDGKDVGTTPFHVAHDPSATSLSFVIRHDGYRDRAVTVTGSSNATSEITLDKKLAHARPTGKKTGDSSVNPF